MSERMKSVPERLDLMTRARMANIMAKNVVTTAANCGLFPKGAEVKNDQLARTKPSRIWRMTIRAALE